MNHNYLKIVNKLSTFPFSCEACSLKSFLSSHKKEPHLVCSPQDEPLLQTPHPCPYANEALCDNEMPTHPDYP
ncbi:hypothetical protein Hanom_Chr11g01010761 [Helianthus anomalus]